MKTLKMSELKPRNIFQMVQEDGSKTNCIVARKTDETVHFFVNRTMTVCWFNKPENNISVKLIA